MQIFAALSTASAELVIDDRAKRPRDPGFGIAVAKYAYSIASDRSVTNALSFQWSARLCGFGFCSLFDTVASHLAWDYVNRLD
jgi:hypothetical protein